jgi:hypothetical protein
MAGINCFKVRAVILNLPIQESVDEAIKTALEVRQ